jgi:hypothetical protein
MKTIIILLMVVFSTELNFSQVDKKYKKLGTEEYEFGDDVKVENDSVNFNGFLIFRINKNPYSGYYPVNDDYYFCNIYLINDLTQLNDENQKFIYDPYILLESKKCFTGDPSEFGERQIKELSADEEKFCDVLEEYKKTGEKNITELPFLYHSLSTQIFERDVKFWRYGNIDTICYFFFYSSFKAILLMGTLKYIDLKVKVKDDNGNEIYKYGVIENAEVLLPISKSCDFQPVEDEKLKSNKFKECYWFPDNLYNEK